MEQEKKDFGRWWVWVLTLFVLSIIVFSGLSYMGIIGRTIVERKVFENSYQRSESVKSEIATFEATLAEIGHKLSGDISEQTRNELEAQASSIRIMLRVARGKQ